MAKPNDISSTEKLLDVIRNTSPMSKTAVHASSDHKLFHYVRRLSGKFTQSVGVDVTGESLRLVKIGGRPDKKPAVLAYHFVPLTDEITKDRSRMIDLLRSELAGFCPPSAAATLWASLSMEETDIRRLLVPKVPKNRLENAVFWTYQKETSIDRNQTLLDFRILGNVIDNGVAKIEVLVCTAPRAGVENLKELFQAAGAQLTGVLAPAFAFQNFFKTHWVDAGDSLICSLLIDFNWSRIEIFRPNGDLIVSRGIKAGITSMVESIKNAVARPAGILSMTGDPDETSAVLEIPVFDATEADRILQLLNIDTPAPLPATAGLLKNDDVFEMVLPAMERLIRQVERTLEHVTLRFSDGPIEKILISGPITAYPRLVNHVGGQLGLPLETVDPFSSIAGGLKAPETAIERAAYISSVGLALSGKGHPPNFLFTHQETVLQGRKNRLHQALLFFILVGIAALWGSHQLQQRSIHDLDMRLYQLNLPAAPELQGNSKESLLTLASRVNNKNQLWKTYSRNYLPVALIGEITTLAPDHIRFICIEGTSPEQPEAEPDENQAQKPTGVKPTAAVDALVRGPRDSAESRLAQYLIALKRSPLFTRVTLKKKTFEHLNSEDVLRFALDLEGA